jgi:hypothetical protein
MNMKVGSRQHTVGEISISSEASNYGSSIVSGKEGPWEKNDSAVTSLADSSAVNTPRVSIDSSVADSYASNAASVLSNVVTIPESLADTLQNDDPDLILAVAPTDEEKVCVVLSNNKALLSQV